jgi:hypothetical protein
MPATYIALRPFRARGVTYQPGQPINTRGWPHKRATLLLGRNFIKEIAPSDRIYLANRTGQINGKRYVKAEIVDVTGLTEDKLDQLVERRILQEAVAIVIPPTTPAPTPMAEASAQAAPADVKGV